MVTTKAKDYFCSLSLSEKNEIAKKVGIKLSHLRNIFYSGATTSPSTAAKIEIATNKKILRSQILPDFDWSIF